MDGYRRGGNGRRDGERCGVSKKGVSVSAIWTIEQSELKWNVHGNVYECVQASGNPLHGNGILETNPAEEERHRVVIEVQETERSLAQNDEYSVKKLIELGEVEHVEPEIESALASGDSFAVAQQAFVSVVLGTDFG